MLMTTETNTNKVHVALEGTPQEYTYTVFEGSVLCQKHGGVVQGKFEVMNLMEDNYIVCPHCYSFIKEENYVLLREHKVWPQL